MKVLLDECIPRKLKNSILDHDCRTVLEAGFAGQKNGRLLSLAETAGFDLFLKNFGRPQDRDCDCARKIESPQGPLATLASLSIDHELDQAWRSDLGAAELVIAAESPCGRDREIFIAERGAE